jgi:hypothetical protein
MAGARVSDRVGTVFERHGALFVDKEEDDGVFARLHPDRDERLVQATFEAFYAANVSYDMTDQWIMRSGPFIYDYRWLSQSASSQSMKEYGDRAFEQVYGVRPDSVELVSLR